MAPYSYKKLTVTCLQPRDFATTDLRAAVEYLRTVYTPETSKFVGVIADAGVIDAGPFKLAASPMLTLEEIEGKTPVEVWEAFGTKLDRERWSLARRGAGIGTSP